VLQCLSKISSTFICNRVTVKPEFCKCLCRDGVVTFDINERVVIRLLCYVSMLEQDVEHLHLQLSHAEVRVV